MLMNEGFVSEETVAEKTGIMTQAHDTGGAREAGWLFHPVRKFAVPDHVLNLLESLPMGVGFGIKGDVLAIEDMFSLLAGWSVKLCRFVELSSLLVYPGWEMKMCNMPAVHAVTMGYALNQGCRSGSGSGRIRNVLPGSGSGIIILDPDPTLEKKI